MTICFDAARIERGASRGNKLMSDAVTLEFLANQQRHILNEISSLRTHFGVMQDDIRVLSAMAVRQDNTTKALVDLVDRIYHELHQEMQGVRADMRRIQEQIQGIDGRLASVEARMQ